MWVVQDQKEVEDDEEKKQEEEKTEDRNYDQSGYNMLIHARPCALCFTCIIFFTCLEPLCALQVRIWIIHGSMKVAGEFSNSATGLRRSEKLCNDSFVGKS